MYELKESERWLEDYAGRYFATFAGEIYSTVHKGEPRKKKESTLNGRKVVQLFHSDGVGEVKYVHKLVADAWIPNPLNKFRIRHKDGNLHNNEVSNLTRVTSRWDK